MGFREGDFGWFAGPFHDCIEFPERDLRLAVLLHAELSSVIAVGACKLTMITILLYLPAHSDHMLSNHTSYRPFTACQAQVVP